MAAGAEDAGSGLVHRPEYRIRLVHGIGGSSVQRCWRGQRGRLAPVDQHRADRGGLGLHGTCCRDGGPIAAAGRQHGPHDCLDWRLGGFGQPAQDGSVQGQQSHGYRDGVRYAFGDGDDQRGAGDGAAEPESGRHGRGNPVHADGGCERARQLLACLVYR